MEIVELGKVVKLHGYLGQMKVSTKYDKDFDIKTITKMFDEDGTEFFVVKIFQTKDGVVVMLDGIDGVKAKSFIGKMLYVERDLFKGKILIEDLKGSTVITDDEKNLGKIIDIQDYGSAEVFFVRNDAGNEVMFPNVKGVIANFDRKNKLLTLSSAKLKEVCDYED